MQVAMMEECPLPKHYIWYAEESNRAALFLLQKNNEELKSASLSISFGLSLHAIELCGKSMLRTLGGLPSEIKTEHGRHKLLDLLGNIERKISTHPEARVQEFKDFLVSNLIIGTEEFGKIAMYLKKHFNCGVSAYPRNYLYPDNEVFSGPESIFGLHAIAEHMIKNATALALALGHESP